MKAFLATLLEQGAQLWVEGDDVCYRAQPNVVTAQVRDALHEHKRELLAFLGDDCKWAPTSFAQQRLWFLDRYDDDSSVYVLGVFAMRLRGTLDVCAFEQAWAAVVKRHEPLRTVFREVDGRPVQLIKRDGVALRHDKLDPRPDRDQRARGFVHEKAAAEFDLERGPLVQPWLGAFDGNDHVFCVPMHHIITDGLSMDVLLRDLVRFYSLARAGGIIHARPPVAYADFACAQRAALRGDRLVTPNTFWRGELADLPARLELPADRPRPVRQTFDGCADVFTLTEQTSAAVQELAAVLRTTPFVVLLTAFAAVLQRWSGQDQFAIGTPVGGRTHPALAELVGFFVNTLPLRVDLQDDIAFDDAVLRMQQVLSGALDHQDLPFERIIEAVKPPRNLSHSPLFQVQFVQEPVPRPVVLEGIAMEEIAPSITKTKYDLGLFVRLQPESISGRLEFNTALFGAATARRFIYHFTHLASAAVADPGARVIDLPLSSTRQHEIDPPFDQAGVASDLITAPQLIHFAAVQHPDRVAIVCGSTSCTYAELSARVERWAGALCALSIVGGQRIGIALPRSIEAVAAMFAVMRAGGAYVMLDADQPAARLHSIAAEAALALVIGDPSQIGDNFGCAVASVSELDRSSMSAPAAWPRAEDAAYVLFTSGSTGTPKGVVVEHRNLVHYVGGIVERLGLPATASYASMTTLAADLGHTAIFPALCRGGTLHLVSRADATSASHFAAYNAQHRIDCLKMVPSHLAALLDGPTPAAVLPRNVLVLGGERCPWELVERIHALRPELRIVNHYGPTETTVGALTHEIDFKGKRLGASVPIGRPLPRMFAEIVDARGRRVADGLPGELYLGGAGVARGYLNRSDLTSAAFVEGSDRPAMRFYRTGDRARVLPNGDVEFLGRTDDQVKIRGFRVEPGEVAALLRAHPAVSDAAVVVVQDQHNGARLAAYVAAPDGLDRAALFAYLRERVPAYMVPESITLLERLPITGNGKLDRSALPTPEPRQEVKSVWTVPQSETERQIAAMWEELLQRSSIGVNDNFLDLGGHSLLAIRIVSRLNEAFDIDLPLAVLFESPTVAGVAKRVEAMRHRTPSRAEFRGDVASANGNLHVGTQNPSRLVAPIRAGASGPALFCIAPAGGTTFPYYALAHHLPASRPVYCLQDPLLDDARPPCATIEEQAAAYLAAIRVTQPSGPYHLAGWSFGGVVAFEIARQLAAEAALVGVVALIESYAPSARRTFYWRDLLPNLAFLTGFAASGLEIIRD
ncbi:MAG: amino acid adenylation domain-containing protein, partial [Candidatus Hydrogenedentales bacterium]